MARQRNIDSRLFELQWLGFDASQVVPQGRDEFGQFVAVGVRARCSQCAVVHINGLACHETGCPNAAAAQRREQEAEVLDEV